jgi:hypothetical protein
MQGKRRVENVNKNSKKPKDGSAQEDNKRLMREKIWINS